MEILIPLIASLIVYIYNYNKLIELKSEVAKITIDMSTTEIWKEISKMKEEFSEKIHSLELRIKGLEVRLGLYSAGAIFVTSLVLKVVDYYIKAKS